MPHQDTLRIVDADNRQVGLVRAVKTARAYEFIWSVFSPNLSGPAGKTGEARTQEEALRDALDAGATLGVAGAHVSSHTKRRKSR